MIFVNGTEISFTSFPDGTTSFRFALGAEPVYNIKWLYDGDHECMLVWYLTNHIRSNVNRDARIKLVMPYIPNARMDRVKERDEVFTLKWFADFINSLNFDSVVAHDPHSCVSEALINRLFSVGVSGVVNRRVMETIHEKFGKDDILLCYPDEGASKRYASQIRGDYVFGIKHRDWRTGEIQGLELVGSEKVNGRTVLIVDDICSRGGTFTHTAKALKDAGADKVFLYVTHCENTIRDGSVLTDGLISHVFTTNSIFRGEHEKVTVFEEV